MSWFSFLLLSVCCYVATAAAMHDGGMSGKFRNLSTRRIKLYWVNYDGAPQMNAVLDTGGILSFQTYIGHNFFWGEYNEGGKTPVPISGNGAKGASFTIAEDQLIYAFIDNSAPEKLVVENQKEVDFLAAYRQRTGRDWLANYPRDPPVLPMRKCTTVGTEIVVPISKAARKTLCADDNEKCYSKETDVTLTCISVNPCAWALTEFLSDFEADWIVNYASPKMQRSGLMGGAEQMEDTQRTSMSYRMDRDTSKYVDRVYRRAAEVLDIPEHIMTNDRNSEPLDVLRYLNGQKYQPHFDWFVSGVSETRFVSFLMYLNTPPKGGSTRFPNGIAADGSQGVTVAAKKRRAFFFYNMLEDGNVDEYSLHEGTPVEKGPKWLATIWTWDPKQSGNKAVTKSEIDKYYRKQVEQEISKTVEKEDL